jgi:hypothetical protein
MIRVNQPFIEEISKLGIMLSINQSPILRNELDAASQPGKKPA